MSDLDRACAILGDLVALPTISADSNLDCIHLIRRMLEPLGARIEITPDATGQKANLFATLGPDTDDGVILSGHVDVVPVEGQEWSQPPFEMHRSAGRLYGRGTCDMKGFVACVLAMAPAIANADLRRPIHIALTHDEEVGCLGAPALLAALARSGRKPAICIVGEPTEMRVVSGHKGCFEYSTHFTGVEGHSSRPDAGVNAVEYAALLVRELMDIAVSLKSRAPQGSPFDPPWTTLSVGRIAGGIAHNVIPNRCTVDWEFRPVDAADADYVKRRVDDYVAATLLPAMRAAGAATGAGAGAAEIGIATVIVGEVAGLAPEPRSPAVDLMTRLTGRNDVGVVAFGTEAGLFQAQGISTVVCGPGSIAQAHRPDEFIGLDQMQACLDVIQRLIASQSA